MHQVESIHFYSILRDKDLIIIKLPVQQLGLKILLQNIYFMNSSNIFLYSSLCLPLISRSGNSQARTEKKNQHDAPKFFSLKTHLACCAHESLSCTSFVPYFYLLSNSEDTFFYLLTNFCS